ncbi:uncharacterized protein [Branchiostoma lanceolatum]|uniref:uncharacterized protein n=1 Tax=Branchiostoma lanceolatum TaxID=7740 RepID=UPI003456BE46
MGTKWSVPNKRPLCYSYRVRIRSTLLHSMRCSSNVTLNAGWGSLVYTFQYNVTGCPEGLYGMYCDKDCVCKNGARCHGFNGACECRPGWRGRACDFPWPEVVILEAPGDSVVKYIGTNLTLTCLAPHIHVANMTWVLQSGNTNNDAKVIEERAVQNNSISFQPVLETANGRYSCLVQAEDGQLFNATFILNATECRPNYHGEACSQVCDCQYGGTCDRWEGCLCPPGRHGDRCEHTCAPGTFGRNCSEDCNCQNNNPCDPVNGSCICAEGQSGEFCENVSTPDNSQVVVVVLASVIPTIAIIGCIVTGILVKRGRRRARTPKHPTEDLEMTSISPWEVAKEDIRFEHMIGQGEFDHVVRGRLRVTITIIGCIVTSILVKRGRRRAGTPEHPTEDLKMTSISPWEVAKEDIRFEHMIGQGEFGTPEDPTEDLEMTSISPWEVAKEDIRFEHMIGQGEFGHIVRGRLRVTEGYEVLVAAKRIRPDRVTASAARDFRREMTILTRIHEDKEGHPNVVKLYGVMTKSEPQYILVEYASNEELRRYLWGLREQCKTTGNSKLLERLGFSCDVASGLSELARLKIVHRDIAARNVVISGRKVAKIADFGLSRDVYMSSAYERTSQGGEEELLPLKWMAMESLRDGMYTCESDVWSYGVLLWEIASFGEEPRYAGGPMHPDVCTMLELLKKGVRLQQPENCPMSVYKIIRSCWTVDPKKRPTPDELFRKIDHGR